MRPVQLEHHRTARIGWLRAAVLGANDGIVSTTVPCCSAKLTHVSVSRDLGRGEARRQTGHDVSSTRLVQG